MENSGLKLQKAVIRGLETAWLEGGEPNGPIMLFLHGYPDSPETFEYQFREFIKSYHVVAPYSRGCLPSAKDDSIDRYGHYSQALDVLEILKKIDPGKARKVIVVGHDLGAAHSWFLAPMLGDRLASLVIFNGMSIHQFAERYKNPQQLMKSWYIYAMLVPVLPKILLRRFSGQFLNFAYKQGGLKDSVRPDMKEALGGVVNPSNQYKAFALDFIKMKREARKKIKAPVLILWGKDDRFLSTPKKHEFYKDADKVTIRLLPCNHWVHREKAQDVNELIQEFLLNQGMVS